jgi:hypothetical protein
MIREHTLATSVNEDALDADAVTEVMKYDPSTFWRRNWQIAERLGVPTPPFKARTLADVPLYCSETGERAIDQGYSCACGCTEYLRAEANEAHQRNEAAQSRTGRRRIRAAQSVAKRLIYDWCAVTSRPA